MIDDFWYYLWQITGAVLFLLMVGSAVLLLTMFSAYVVDRSLQKRRQRRLAEERVKRYASEVRAVANEYFKNAPSYYRTESERALDNWPEKEKRNEEREQEQKPSAGDR